MQKKKAIDRQPQYIFKILETSDRLSDKSDKSEGPVSCPQNPHGSLQGLMFEGRLPTYRDKMLKQKQKRTKGHHHHASWHAFITLKYFIPIIIVYIIKGILWNITAF